MSLGAKAISHLEKISNAGIKAMANSLTVGVVLPTTAYILKLVPPPVKKMIQEGRKIRSFIHLFIRSFVRSFVHSFNFCIGAAVALGSDFNPNAFCLSMVGIYASSL